VVYRHGDRRGSLHRYYLSVLVLAGHQMKIVRETDVIHRQIHS
jgi:hypothetical protein